MFAVPGWNVAASLLTTQQASNKTADGSSNRSSKKRKRDTDRSERDAAADRLLSEQVKDKHLTSRLSQEEEEDLQPSISQKSGAHRVEGNVLSHSGHVQKKTAPSSAGNKSNKQNDGPLIGPEHRRERKKQRKELERLQNGTAAQVSPGSQLKPPSQSHSLKQTATTPAIPPSLPPTTAKLTPLQSKMRNKLTSARFRHLNETLYTTSSTEALNLFTNSPDLFADYHAGFAQQVKESWPQNPVDGYIKTIKARGEGSTSTPALPRRKTGSCTITDLGCGDAPLARGCQSVVKILQLKFHNYDLHAPNTFVTKADISNLPLRDGEADIAVFCLSLMGTNWISFVEEAWRILRGDGKGEVWIAEVKSRFGRVIKGRVVENSVGKRRKVAKPKKQDDDETYNGPEQFAQTIYDEDDGDAKDETDISAFLQVFTRRGFQLRPGSIDLRNKMFVTMVFTKTGIPTTGKHKGMKWNGKEYMRVDSEGRAGPRVGLQPRFTNGIKKAGDGDGEVTVEDESKTLKPCVYKVR